MTAKTFSKNILPLLACILLCGWPLQRSAQIVGILPASSTPPGKCGTKEFLDIGSGECQLCAPNQIKSPNGLRCVCVAGTNQSSPPLDCSRCSTLPPRTLWETLFLDTSFLACNNTCNLTACQLLTNMVTMEAFSLHNRAYDLYTKTKSQDLPKLWYGSSETFPRVSFGKNSRVRLQVTKYDVRGNFLGWEDVSGGTLQLCPGSQNVLDAAFMFGTSYHQSCSLEVLHLLQRYPEPTFYELFLQYDDEKGNVRWWPVPVENPAIRTSSTASLSSWAFRRFFLVDGLSGRKQNLTNPPETLTVATDLLLSEILREDAVIAQEDAVFRNNSIFSRDFAVFQNKPSFSITYIHDPGTAQRDTDIALAVLGSLSVLYALLKVSSWGRRSRLENINLMIVMKFFAYLAGSLANVFFLISLGIGIYWLIVFKGQQFSAIEVTLPPAGGQIEIRFVIYVLCSLVLKTLDVTHLLITQLTVSIFMIDWEKPKEKGRPRIPAGGGDQRAASSVSAWRTFLIANEWNELQTHRKVNPSLQLLSTLLLLEVVGLKNLASRDLNVNLHPGSNAYLAPWSPILRFGIAASVWLAVGIVQVAISVGFYERFVEDKIQQFTDLCSLSNVSVFILMHRCYGYYIHGRSVHGHADVSMDTMHSYLRKEEENLCPLRGLEANSDIQTFEVLLTNRIRVLYDRINLPLVEAPRRVRSDVHDQRLRSYHTLNHFLASFLEHRYKDMDYVVKDKFLLERILDIEFQEPGDVSVLYNDESALFGRALFYNHELTLLLFEALVFCAVDLGAQDFVLATIVTFVVQKLLQTLRDFFGRKNLAEKTLVENQFLI